MGLAILAGCDSSDFEGHKRLQNSIHYKRVSLGDDELVYSDGARISISVRVKTSVDSLIALKRFQRVELNQIALPDYFTKFMTSAHQGDSTLFIGLSDDFELEKVLGKKLEHNDTVKIEVMVTEVLTDEQLRTKRAEERMLLDAELLEQQQLQVLLDSFGLDRDHFVDGIYYKTISRGNGKRATPGNNIRVNYKSTLVNGQIIDNTYEANSLEYEVGRPDQVLDGFAIGISLMREGGESLMILPSNMAFGDKGSSSKIVPPFHTIIYHVKLEKVGV
jgi:FKBP-type peptidyl-prolyl cis-trans isomerase